MGMLGADYASVGLVLDNWFLISILAYKKFIYKIILISIWL